MLFSKGLTKDTISGNVFWLSRVEVLFLLVIMLDKLLHIQCNRTSIHFINVNIAAVTK